MTTKVVNLHSQSYDVYIGRAGKGQDGYFGNPFRVIDYLNPMERALALIQYTRYFNKKVATDVEFANRVLLLREKRLGCFCKPNGCHGDVIAAWVDAAVCADCGDQAVGAIKDPEPVKTTALHFGPVRVLLLCNDCMGK